MTEILPKVFLLFSDTNLSPNSFWNIKCISENNSKYLKLQSMMGVDILYGRLPITLKPPSEIVFGSKSRML